MTSKLTITRERLEKIKSWRETYGAGSNVMLPAEEAEELARMALAAMDSEPVGEVIEVGDALLVEWHKNLEEGAKLYTTPQAPVMPFGLHPDTQKLVTDFCTALAEKLYKAQLKYGYDADWKHDGWPSQCQAHFHQHVAKGDPRDVAAYCAFMWYHGWKTEAAQPAPVVPDEVRRCLGFFASVIKSGEQWTSVCQHEYDTALEAMLQAGNSPVIPDGYVMVPIEPTQAMCAAFNDSDYGRKSLRERYVAMLAAAPQEGK